MKILGIIAAVVLGLIGLWMFYFPSVTKNVRLTIEVETPEGLKSGSSISELTFALGWPPMAGYHGLTVGVSGEAVVVDLGKRGTLYALLCGRDRQGRPGGGTNRIGMFLKSYGVPPFTGVGDTVHIAGVKAARGKVNVSASDLPFFAHFKDEREPKSVEAVDPANLAASFGEGVKLKRVSIETTDDPVGAEIHKRLFWLSQYPEPSLAPSSDPLKPTIQSLLHHGDFRRTNP